MRSKYTLIPRLESFMEDIDTIDDSDSVTVTPEDIDKVVQTSEEGEQEGTTFAKLERLSNQLSYLTQEYNTWNDRLEYVREYGADRTFMRLFNSNGEFNQAFNIVLPSCEDFNPIGNKNSYESKAIIAGLEGILGNIWEWICNLLRKIKEFFTGSSSSTSSSVGSTSKEIKITLKEIQFNQALKNIKLGEGPQIFKPENIKKAVDFFLKNVLFDPDKGLITGTDDCMRFFPKVSECIEKLEKTKPQQWPSVITETDRESIRNFKKTLPAVKQRTIEIRKEFSAFFQEKDDAIGYTVAELVPILMQHSSFKTKWEAIQKRESYITKEMFDETEKQAKAMQDQKLSDEKLQKISKEFGTLLLETTQVFKDQYLFILQAARMINRAFDIINRRVIKARTQGTKKDTKSD